MKPIFEIDGKDFAWILGEGGIQWSRNDLDSERTGRSLSGKMFRVRVAMKRKLSIGNCKRLTTEQLVALNTALYPPLIRVKFLDAITGQPYEGTFYGSSVESTTQIYDDITKETYWEGTTFSLIEQ